MNTIESIAHVISRRVSNVVAIAGTAFLASTAVAQPVAGSGSSFDPIVWGIIGIVLLVGFFVVIFLLQFLSLYIQALTSNASVGLLDMVGM